MSFTVHISGGDHVPPQPPKQSCGFLPGFLTGALLMGVLNLALFHLDSKKADPLVPAPTAPDLVPGSSRVLDLVPGPGLPPGPPPPP